MAGVEAALFARYAARLRPQPELIEVAAARGAPAEIRRREAAGLLHAVPDGAWLVALDMGGQALSSEAFARALGEARSACFAVGGAEGLDAAVLARARLVLSLGPQTWPHMLARLMLVEQIFRAQCIAAGHPYHRGARP
jgi:23S rRNA (pseudouridine1915-N3)-methyltransferase